MGDFSTTSDIVYNKPWWKERLRQKYLRPRKPSESAASFFDAKNWTFLQDGMDDFRDGLPPYTCTTKDVVRGAKKGLGPSITGDYAGPFRASANELHRATKREPYIPMFLQEEMARQKRLKELEVSKLQPGEALDDYVGPFRFTKEEICLSKVIPLKQRKQRHVDDIEDKLSQHPLVLYPHLGESLPSDLFEEIVKILDPEIIETIDDGLMSEEGDDGVDRCMKAGTPHVPDIDPTLTILPDINKDQDSKSCRNPYRWMARSGEEIPTTSKKFDPRKATIKQEGEQELVVTKAFCDWVASLGGETNNIEESTIRSLFVSGYETKPALSVPIHVVDINNVPPELRMSAAVPLPATTPNTLEQVDKIKVKQTVKPDTLNPDWVKFKYGAWYLDPKLWKKRLADQPLDDPKHPKDSKEMSESKKKSLSLDFDLAPLHGAKLFKEFVEKKDTRKPDFLKHISHIQAEQQREEQARQEAELAKLKKMSGVRYMWGGVKS